MERRGDAGRGRALEDITPPAADPIETVLAQLWSTRAKNGTSADVALPFDPWPVGQVHFQGNQLALSTRALPGRNAECLLRCSTEVQDSDGVDSESPCMYAERRDEPNSGSHWSGGPPQN